MVDSSWYNPENSFLIQAYNFHTMAGIIGTKLEMTRIVHNGAFTPVTLVKVPTLTVAQIKTVETDGYDALVMEFLQILQKIQKFLLIFLREFLR